MSITTILNRQNADGGWSYVQGRTWTEPTAFAVLALLSAGETDRAKRGIAWLRSSQRKDGGWPAQVGIDESTWVTALPAFLPPELLGTASHEGAVRWLMELTGVESTLTQRLRVWLMGHSRPVDQKDSGWPWVPGTAAWVGPTVFAILALEKAALHQPAASRARERVAVGRAFLFSRMCKGGGWNHGSARALGYELPAYPETTGLGLMALRGVDGSFVKQSLSLAAGFLQDCHSVEACNWLRLGLMAHGQSHPGVAPKIEFDRRSTAELALDVLVDAAAAGRNPFWSES